MLKSLFSVPASGGFGSPSGSWHQRRRSPRPSSSTTPSSSEEEEIILSFGDEKEQEPQRRPQLRLSQRPQGWTRSIRRTWSSFSSGHSRTAVWRRPRHHSTASRRSRCHRLSIASRRGRYARIDEPAPPPRRAWCNKVVKQEVPRRSRRCAGASSSTLVVAAAAPCRGAS